MIPLEFSISSQSVWFFSSLSLLKPLENTKPSEARTICGKCLRRLSNFSILDSALGHVPLLPLWQSDSEAGSTVLFQSPESVSSRGKCALITSTLHASVSSCLDVPSTDLLPPWPPHQFSILFFDLQFTLTTYYFNCYC